MANRLISHKNFRDFLNFASNSGSIIAQLFQDGSREYITDEGNYIMVEDGEIDVISFLPKSKYNKIDENSSDVWEKFRVKMKIGKFVSKFLTSYSVRNWTLGCSQIEQFVNLYKSYHSTDATKFEIISGNDIMKYYLENNYYAPGGNRYGTLWGSCMRQKERNKFMALYAKNPNVKMLVSFADDRKIRARALLWENVKDHCSDKEYKFMDRIYTVFDHDVNLFKRWARDNGYLSKKEQNAKSELYFNDIDGSTARFRLYVNLNTDKLDSYPFLDTFKFYNPENSRFSNSKDYDYKYCLTQSTGGLEPQPRPDRGGGILGIDWTQAHAQRLGYQVVQQQYDAEPVFDFFDVDDNTQDPIPEIEDEHVDDRDIRDEDPYFRVATAGIRLQREEQVIDEQRAEFNDLMDMIR